MLYVFVRAISFGALLMFSRLQNVFDKYPNIKAWWATVTARPSVGKALARFN